jgi:hypothetical protein
MERADREGLAKNFNGPLWFLSFFSEGRLPSHDKSPLEPDSGTAGHRGSSPSGTSDPHDSKQAIQRLYCQTPLKGTAIGKMAVNKANVISCLLIDTPPRFNNHVKTLQIKAL